jgi:hypothetical protein
MRHVGTPCRRGFRRIQPCQRLKSRPNIVRQRIGIDFRLLFRLPPDHIQVIDLIPRQDFERKIKTL